MQDESGARWARAWPPPVPGAEGRGASTARQKPMPRRRKACRRRLQVDPHVGRQPAACRQHGGAIRLDMRAAAFSGSPHLRIAGPAGAAGPGRHVSSHDAILHDASDEQSMPQSGRGRRWCGSCPGVGHHRPGPTVSAPLCSKTALQTRAAVGTPRCGRAIL